ncbi:hypothetical protein AVEN_220212-1 [Araneus ventricosus]|uniref:Uncharacterized protein n=1 Tax=Araneus ventricosus TaxID=182803 RepID=A0A4Y2GZG6_ARAVE|nr:hypothetical protein AVEN_220212-1 [Araneus ventricosus]
MYEQLNSEMAAIKSYSARPIVHFDKALNQSLDLHFCRCSIHFYKLSMEDGCDTHLEGLPEHPLASLQPSEVASTSTSPPVVPPPRAPPTIVLRRSNSRQYSCHLKEERQELEGVSERGHQEQATFPSKRKLGAAGSSKENVPAKKPRVLTTDARLKRMASRKTPKVACPKKEDDKRFKEALLKAKLQLANRGKGAKRTGGDGDL